MQDPNKIINQKEIFENSLDKSKSSRSDEISNISARINIKEEVSLKGKTKSQNISQPKGKRIYLIICTIISVVLIAGTTLLLGYLYGGWFQTKQDLIVEVKRNEKMVTRYLETKNVTYYYDIDNLEEAKRYVNNTITTDFIVGINSKKRMRYFGEIDYLYESLLLILNITSTNKTDSNYLGGIDIYDETKSIEELIEMNMLKLINSNNLSNEQLSKSKENITNEIPFCKFYFYENGTLGEIYIPKNLNAFYQSVLEDLIKKITPKLSKSLYNNEDTKRRLDSGEEGTYLNYETVKNGEVNNTIIYENTKEKNINKNKGKESTLENSELNSKMKRTFDSKSGEMTTLNMEGDVSLKSAPQNSQQDIKDNDFIYQESNNSYSKLVINEFKTNVTSNMKLLKKKKEDKILSKLNKLYKKLIFELLQQTNNTFKSEQGNITEINSNANKSNKPEDKKQTRILSSIPNYSRKYEYKYSLIKSNFLGFSFDLNQYLTIDNTSGLRKSSAEINISGRKLDLLEATSYQNSSNIKNETSKVWNKGNSYLNKCFQPFGISLCIGFNTIINCKTKIIHDVLSEEAYTEAYSTFDVGVEASIGTDLFIISLQVALNGYLAKGESKIQAYSLTKSNSSLAKFDCSKKFSAGGVDLKFIFTYRILWWSNTETLILNLYSSYKNSESTSKLY